MRMARAYEEIIEFLAAGFTSDSLIAYQPSEETKSQVEDLIRREKNEGLTREESSELNHYMELDHILTLAKARARARQSNG
jgi:hypothetical protein